MLIYVPKETAILPRTGECIIDHWWVIHPERGLVFFVPSLRHSDMPAPQCNLDQRVTDRLCKQLYSNCHVEQISIVFMAHAAATRLRMIMEENLEIGQS